MAGWDGSTGTVLGQTGLRRHNLGVVLRHLRDHGARSRARVAADTGLNKATVSSLVAELADRGLVSEGVRERGSVGRPGTVIDVDGVRVCGIGALLDVDHIGTLALDLRGAVVSERHLLLRPRRLTATEVVDHLAGLIAETVDDISARGVRPVGLTIGVAGLVDAAAGVVTLAPNLGWWEVPVADLLNRRLGTASYPVHVDNGANLAAVAESRARTDGTRDLVVLVGGFGLGGGLVSDGRLLRGRRGFAGELGHLPVEPHGARCACGRTGCWETRVGLGALLGAVADRDDPVRDPDLPVAERLAEVDRRAAAGDGRTRDGLHQLGRWLGVGAATLVNVLDPRVVVLSGYFPAVGRWLLDPMGVELAAATPTRDGRPQAAIGRVDAGTAGCAVELSTIGFDAAVRGAAQTALEQVFADPTVVPRQHVEESPAPQHGRGPHETVGGSR